MSVFGDLNLKCGEPDDDGLMVEGCIQCEYLSATSEYNITRTFPFEIVDIYVDPVFCSPINRDLWLSVGRVCLHISIRRNVAAF